MGGPAGKKKIGSPFDPHGQYSSFIFPRIHDRTEIFFLPRCECSFRLINGNHDIGRLDHRIDGFPLFQSETLAERFVMMATTSSPPGKAMVTSELTAPGVMDLTFPFNTFRALIFMVFSFQDEMD